MHDLTSATVEAKTARAHDIAEGIQSPRLRLLVLTHANRAAGGRAVGLNLLQALADLSDRVDLTAVLPVGCGYEVIAERYAFPAIWFRQSGSFAKRFLFDAVALPKKVRSVEPDAILALGNIGLLNPPVPQAVLIHDAHYVYPRCHYGSMTALQHMRYVVQIRQLRRCIANSSIIYCQTPTMLRRVQMLSPRLRQANVLPNCMSSFAQSNPEPVSIPPQVQRYAGQLRLICLSRYYPHKNLEGIVETFRLAREQLEGVVVFLTVAAGQHPNAKRLLYAIDQLGLSDRIINLGPIEPHAIPACFEHCDALLFPTRMESFSATYLEAMGSGLPVLTSDLDFAREVCGEAALYFDPWSSESMAQAIIRLRDDAGLRKRLAEESRRRMATAHDRSWKDVAQLITSDLQQIIQHTQPTRH